jgi:hypothetical protein
MGTASTTCTTGIGMQSMKATAMNTTIRPNTGEDHRHGSGDCTHESVQHGDHVDYVHDGHLHAEHGDHNDEH